MQEIEMKNRREKQLFLLFVTCIGLVLRKFMIPGASLLLIVTLILLATLFFISGFRSISHRKERNGVAHLLALGHFYFALSSIAFLFRNQYWNSGENLLWVGFVGLIVLVFFLVRYFFFQHTDPVAEKRIFRELLIPFLFFLLVIPFSVLSNQRQFHNFFRGSTYESYVRKTYEEEEALPLLEQNQCNSPECIKKGNEYFHEGLKNDSIKKWDAAFDCYNKAIDYNIHFTDAYVRRATNRMLHAVVDKEIILSAIRDCNIAIVINPRYAQAYARRGFTYYLSKKPDKACADFKKANELNSNLKLEEYIKSTCGN